MRAVAAVALLFCSSAAIGAHEHLDPRDGVILPPGVSKDFLHQCSRAAPQSVSGTWVPTQKQIRELETRLPAALETVAFQRGNQFAQSADFRRQYAGFVVQSRKIIYVNAFARHFGDPNPNGPPGAWHFNWRREIVEVCDGGPAFFGVEYDPGTQTFNHFEFNGIP